MTKKQVKVKGWAVLYTHSNGVSSVHIQRKHAITARNESVFEKYVIPCTITYVSPILPVNKKRNERIK